MSIRTKLFAPLLLLSTLFMGFTYLFWLPGMAVEITRLQEQEYRTHLRSVAEGLIPLLLENQLANVHESLDALSEDNQNWQLIALHAGDGSRLYPLDEVSIPQPDANTLVIRQPVGLIAPPLAELTIAIDITPVLNAASNLQNQMRTAITVLLLALIAAVALSIELLVRRRIRQLVVASNRLALGDYEAPLPVPRRDEISDLTRSFAAMRSSLQGFHSRLHGEADNHRRTAEALKKAKLDSDYQASHDSLTGLRNRQEFERCLALSLEESRYSSTVHSLLYIDLDQFKVVNDSCGHIAGDELLRNVTALISRQVRNQDVFARLGGDEFGLLLKNCDQHAARQVAEKICESVHDYRFGWQQKIFGIGTSIGLVQLDQSVESTGQLMSQADSACYLAKDSGRNQVQVYQHTDESIQRHQREMLWTSRIQSAMDKNRFELYVQPICSLAASPEQQPSRWEVLLRLRAHNGELILPGAFMPAAERYGIATKIDRRVFDSLTEQLSGLPEDGSHYHFSINIGGASVCDPELLSHFATVIGNNRWLASRLCFEITESEAIRNLTRVQNFIDRLRPLGCRFALDDFGTGMCSFSYLKTLRVDYLKIDGAFVRNIASDNIDRVTVESIHAIGHAMGLKTIAECIETPAALCQLSEIGIDYGQGFHLGHPIPLRELTRGQPIPEPLAG